MSNKCANPYSNSQRVRMRSPTKAELKRWKNQADKGMVDLYNKGRAIITICQDCGKWSVEIQNERFGIPSPFRYELGDRVRITLKGKHYGMSGIIKDRKRFAKTIYPPPIPDNYYKIIFEGERDEGWFHENHLEPIKKNL